MKLRDYKRKKNKTQKNNRSSCKGHCPPIMFCYLFNSKQVSPPEIFIKHLILLFNAL